MRTRPNLSLIRRLLPAGACALLAYASTQVQAGQPFSLSSPGLADGGTLDASHAASANNCGGRNISPALQWHNAPAGTKSFAVTMSDPDGAKGLGVVHWVVYGIAPTATGIGAGEAAPAGSMAGLNVTGGPGYHGPCPPVGDLPHHYVVQVFALDLPPNAMPAGLKKDALFEAIQGHVLAASSTVLRYGR
jgi:Raf kinase inhibitor-like YbhB/YbcL family protein